MSDAPAAPHAKLEPPPERRYPLDRTLLFAIFFFAVYSLLLYQLARVLAPFLAPLLAAAMLAVVVYPLRRHALAALKQPNAAAFALTVLTIVTVVAPASVLAWMVTREATTAMPALSDWLASQQAQGWPFVRIELPAPIAKSWATVSDFAESIGLDFKSVILESVRAIGNRATSMGAVILREFLVLVFELTVLVFALFFFLRDGPHLIANVLDLIPMERRNKLTVLRGLDRTLVAMLRGTVITASAQGFLTGVGLAIFGVKFPVLLGFAASFLAIVPFIGAATVWIPCALYLLLTGKTVAAIGLAIWGMVIVGLVDNLLRPIVVGGGARLPATLLFLAIIGGFQVYGLVGGLISPLLLACVFAFARIYRETYVGAAPDEPPSLP